MASKGREMTEINATNSSNKQESLQKSYFDVLGLCCSSEVPLIEKILKPLEGVIDVSVIVPSRTVIVVHDSLLISQLQIVKALNQARLEANVRIIGKTNYRGKWPSPYVILSGLLLALSFLKYVYNPLKWLALGAVAAGIWPIMMRGAVAIRNFSLDVNILMLIAVVGTIVMRDYTEAGTIVFLFTISEWLESRASHKATAVMSSLMSMAPQKATIAETGEVVNVEDVKLNTILAVKAGESIPVDGVIVDGTCEVDEKTLTGESFPVAKQQGDEVWAGTVNVNGYVSVKTTALAENCAVAKMARLVEEAQNNRSSVQRLIDRCAKYYTPAVVLLSAGLAVIPAIMKVHDLRHWFHLALVVLVSACPCGLILSTPVATFCALSRAATVGLLIKGGDYLELLAKLKFIAFDKTGTLTRGEFTLMDFQSLADDVGLSTLLYWVSSIESKSSHPIAAVLVEHGRSKSVEPKPENVEDFQNFPGEGVFGKIDGHEIFIGNKKLGQRAKCTTASNGGRDTTQGRTSGYIYSGGVIIGTFSLSDNCRMGAKDALRELKSLGIKTALLTGDGQSAANHAQVQLGHGLDIVHAELMPEDKARIIKQFKQEGKTGMVGDGVNDAPALATADVGISMGVSGSALATETGHVILMSNDIRKIPKAVRLARRTRRKVIENIFFSIATKAGVLAFAFAGHPLVWLAVLVDTLTCLIVILNSMLLLRGSRGHKHGHGHKGHSHKSKCSSSTPHCSKMNQRCCSETTAPKKCESKTCHSTENCSTPCHTGKCTDSENVVHQHKDAHHSHDHNHCSDHTTSECTSQHQPDLHNSSVCQDNVCGVTDACESSCCEDDHCLDVENQGCCGVVGDAKKNEGICRGSDDQIREPIQHEGTSVNSSDHEHHIAIENHQHHEQKTCCEAVARDHKISCRVQEQNNPVVDVPRNETKNSSRCHSHGIHKAHHHGHHRAHHHGGHHHGVSHGTCHGEAVAKHACNSLRKREVGACCRSYRKECCKGSHGHFVAGFGAGLTEIITE